MGHKHSRDRNAWAQKAEEERKNFGGDDAKDSKKQKSTQASDFNERIARQRLGDHPLTGRLCTYEVSNRNVDFASLRRENIVKKAHRECIPSTPPSILQDLPVEIVAQIAMSLVNTEANRPQLVDCVRASNTKLQMSDPSNRAKNVKASREVPRNFLLRDLVNFGLACSRTQVAFLVARNDALGRIGAAAAAETLELNSARMPIYERANRYLAKDHIKKDRRRREGEIDGDDEYTNEDASHPGERKEFSFEATALGFILRSALADAIQPMYEEAGLLSIAFNPQKPQIVSAITVRRFESPLPLQHTSSSHVIHAALAGLELYFEPEARLVDPDNFDPTVEQYQPDAFTNFPAKFGNKFELIDSTEKLQKILNSHSFIELNDTAVDIASQARTITVPDAQLVLDILATKILYTEEMLIWRDKYFLSNGHCGERFLLFGTDAKRHAALFQYEIYSSFCAGPYERGVQCGLG